MVKANELGSLPERSVYKETIEKTSDGFEVITLELKEIVAGSLEDDDVLGFVEDGRLMAIGHDEEGVFKYAD